jgi:hypothetical protein
MGSNNDLKELHTPTKPALTDSTNFPRRHIENLKKNLASQDKSIPLKPPKKRNIIIKRDGYIPELKLNLYKTVDSNEDPCDTRYAYQLSTSVLKRVIN